jgi:hypothetical protein
MQVFKQRAVGGALVAFLMSSSAAFCQSTLLNAIDVPIANQITVNQCSAGEPVALNGMVHVEFALSTDSNGNNLFAVTASNNLTGVGQSTAAQYTAADSEDYTLSSNQSSTDGTVQLKADLAPQGGTGTATTLVQQLQISVDNSGNLNVQVVSNTTRCGS